MGSGLQSAAEYFNAHSAEIIIGLVIAIVSAIIVELFLHPFRRRKERKKNSKAQFIFAGKSSLLTPQIVMGITRPYDPYYYQREMDTVISKLLAEGRNILITGPPLAGKSRAVYQMFSAIKKPCNIAIPRFSGINVETFDFPKNTDIVFIDDLQRFVEVENFDHLFKTALEEKISIIAISQSELEFEKVKNKFQDSNMAMETVFGKNDIVQVPFISEDTGKEIAEKVKLQLDRKGFNKTVGSIFMNLSEMEKRFNECTSEEKTILRALKDMYSCGVYEENMEFMPGPVKCACRAVGLEGKDFEWSAWFESLKKRQFLILKPNSVLVEQCYLESVVKPLVERSELEIFELMINAFSESPAELLSIGSKAFDIGRISLEWADYMKAALKAFDGTLKYYTFESQPLEYANTQNNLSRAYNSLAEIEDRRGNCVKSFNACGEALRVYTIDKYPMQFATMQNNLGGAFNRLAELENRAANSKNSILTGEEALKVSSPEQFPLQYAGALYNQGIAYRTLAELEDRAGNSRKSIRACSGALVVYTPELFPSQYGTMQSITGLAYITLSEVEDKMGNSKKAIEELEKALKVCTLEAYPNSYATTQHNLGTAYFSLAEVENKNANCKNSIKAFEEVLKIRTLEKFPIQYAMAYCNLGNVYCIMAGVEDKAANCRTSIKACGESLRVFTLEEFHILYATTQNILASAYVLLADIEDRAANCKLSIKASEEALRAYKPEQFPIQYAGTQHSLGDAYAALAEIENKDENCKKGISAYEEAIKYHSEKDYPVIYQSLVNSLNALRLRSG